VALVISDVPEKRIASIIRVERVPQLLVAANLVPSSPILITLMMVVICSSETSILTRATRHHLRRRHSSSLCFASNPGPPKYDEAIISRLFLKDWQVQEYSVPDGMEDMNANSFENLLISV
jgi:hypothetical protein